MTTIADIEEISKPNLNHVSVVLDNEWIAGQRSLYYSGSDIIVCSRQIPINDNTDTQQQSGNTRISNNLQHTTNSGDQSQHISVIYLWKVNTFTHLEA